jgi:hypothetical protein
MKMKKIKIKLIQIIIPKRRKKKIILTIPKMIIFYMKIKIYLIIIII